VSKFIVQKDGSKIQELALDAGHEYIVGRSSQSDIVLDDLPGISRQHFKIAFIDGSWQILVQSKLGTLIKNGQPATNFSIHGEDVFELPPYEFILVEESNLNNHGDHGNSINLQPSSTALAVLESGFQGDNEVTSVGVFKGIPYLRISGPQKSQEEVLRLEGHSWIAGRDESSSIVLKDATASRRQFRIDFENMTFYISDLESSNGTLVNGAQITEKTVLKSGDIISVQSLTIHFELRDPTFQEKVQNLPEHLLNNLLNDPSLAIDQNSVFHEATPMDAYLRKMSPGQGPLTEEGSARNKKKKLIFYGAVAIVVILIASLFSGNSKKGDNANTPTNSAKFDHLTPAQKQLVTDSYNLANSFLLQGNYANAQAQLKKISDILGEEAYLDSRNLAEACQSALDNEKKINQIEADRKAAEQVNKRVGEILFHCNQVSQTATSEDVIDQCLKDAIDLDPNNEEITIQKERVRKRIADLNERASQQAEHRVLLQRARDMYNRARNLETKGELLKAIEAYEKLISTNLPDPENRKPEAERKIASIKQNLSQKSEELISSSQKFAEGSNLKDALGELIKAQKIDPNNAKVTALIKKYRGELDSQLQELFADATIYEGNSRLEKALEIWKKITDLDRSDGEYYKKAKSKLRTYGNH